MELGGHSVEVEAAEDLPVGSYVYLPQLAEQYDEIEMNFGTGANYKRVNFTTSRQPPENHIRNPTAGDPPVTLDEKHENPGE